MHRDFYNHLPVWRDGRILSMAIIVLMTSNGTTDGYGGRRNRPANVASVGLDIIQRSTSVNMADVQANFRQQSHCSGVSFRSGVYPSLETSLSQDLWNCGVGEVAMGVGGKENKRIE